MTNIEETILDIAIKRVDSAEVIYEEGESRSVSFENNKLKSITTSSIRGVGLRVIRDGRIGFSSATDLRQPEKLVENAIESARFGQEARFEFPGMNICPDVKVFDEAVVTFQIERCVGIGEEVINHALSINPEYECNAGFSKGIGKTRLLNSNGLDFTCRSTSFAMAIDILHVKNESLLSVSEGESSCKLATDLAKHADKALDFIRLAEEEYQIITGIYPVIFSSKCIGTLLATFESGCNGKLVQKGASPLIGKLGEKIIDTRLSIYDDPMIDYADGSGPIDGEGVLSQRTPLFEDGILRNYIYDLQTAGIMDVKSTGNGERSFGSQPYPGYSNITIKPGDMKLQDMISDIKKGILVDQMLGGGQSNILAGEFSVNIELGFLIENGQIVGRVKDCMLAGNVFDLFNKIIAIGEKSEWHGSLCAPPFYFEGIKVAGKGTE